MREKSETGQKLTGPQFACIKNMHLSLQCFDAVGWAAGRASGL